MSFTNPLALWLLLLLPIFIMVGWPRTIYRRTRALLSLIVRLLLVLLLIFALAGFQLPHQVDRLAVVFLVDASDSMSPRTREAALDYVRAAAAEMNAERDQAAVVLFGANAVVEQPMSDSLNLNQIGANPITLNTNLAEAIRLALALFPPDAAKRIVILSDGVETVGDAESAARLAAAAGVRLDYVPFPREVSPDEILVSSVSIPPRVNESELFDLVVNVESQANTGAELRILAAGEIIYRQDVALTTGNNRFAIGPLSLPSTGFVDFRVQVEPQGADGFFQNNELSAFTEVKGRDSVLLVTSDEREIEFLRAALEENGLIVDVVVPRDLPAGLAGLSQYNSVVLANVSATSLPADRMDLLQIYVRDLGGGLVAVGGPNSYGVGGYFETPLEETLPVEMRIRDQERVPTLTMLFVLDRSGSMEMVSDPRGYTNLELAKEAILRSFNLLNDYDRVGVMSFDTGSAMIVDLQDVGDQGNRQRLENEVAALRAGGGTDIYGALVNAARIMPTEPTALKHMILLTDGGASPLQSVEVAQQMYQNYGITLTVVAVGQGYVPWIQQLPQVAGGNFHEAFDVSTIPSIFAAETVLATRSYIFEEEFNPVQTARSPILDGIQAVPSLGGYVATTEKNTATVIFRSPEEDPLLASWQYGLGRAVAFTSDASARWGVNWVTWEDYSRFWGQAVRWTITEGTNDNLEVRVEQRGDQAYLIVDARDDDGEFLNGLNLSAAVVDPSLGTHTISVQQVAPGRYEVPFTPNREGAYFVRVAGATGGNRNLSVAQTAGWVLSYSAEYSLMDADERFLGQIASLTGGGNLANEPATAFLHNLSDQRASQPIFDWLLALAALLLVLDVALRRIVITRSDLDMMRAWLAGRIGLGSVRPATAPATGRMVGLMEAKRRAGSQLSQDEASLAPAVSTDATPPNEKRRGLRRGSGQKEAKKAPASGNLASRLLETRNQQDDQ